MRESLRRAKLSIRLIGERYGLTPEGADDAQADKLHWDNLKRCDAVLVYYGGARQDWFDYRLQDLERGPALERAGPLLARGVYVTSPRRSARRFTSRTRTRASSSSTAASSPKSCSNPSSPPRPMARRSSSPEATSPSSETSPPARAGSPPPALT